MTHNWWQGLLTGLAVVLVGIGILFALGICEVEKAQPKVVMVPTADTPTPTARPVTPIPVVFVTPTPDMKPSHLGSGGLLGR